MNRPPHKPIRPKPKNPLAIKPVWKPGQTIIEADRRKRKLYEKHLEEPRR